MGGRGGGGDVGSSNGSDLEMYQEIMLTLGARLCICACVLSHLGTGASRGDSRGPYLPTSTAKLLPDSGLMGDSAEGWVRARTLTLGSERWPI